MFDFINSSWEIIWFIGLFFCILSFTEKDDRKMFLLLALASFFYWLHFYWVWLLTASFLNFLEINKNLLALKYKKNLYIFFIFIISYLIIWWLTANWEIISYLIIIASIISIYAAFFLEWLKLRITYLTSNMFNLIYNFIWWSIAWTVSCILFMIILSYSSYILYKRKHFWGKILNYKYLLGLIYTKRWILLNFLYYLHLSHLNIRRLVILRNKKS